MGLRGACIRPVEKMPRACLGLCHTGHEGTPVTVPEKNFGYIARRTSWIRQRALKSTLDISYGSGRPINVKTLFFTFDLTSHFNSGSVMSFFLDANAEIFPKPRRLFRFYCDTAEGRWSDPPCFQSNSGLRKSPSGAVICFAPFSSQLLCQA